MGTVNFHLVIKTVEEDVAEEVKGLIARLEALGHKVESAVLTTDGGQVKLSAASDTAVKDAETDIKEAVDPSSEPTSASESGPDPTTSSTEAVEEPADSTSPVAGTDVGSDDGTTIAGTIPTV